MRLRAKLRVMDDPCCFQDCYLSLLLLETSKDACKYVTYHGCFKRRN